jgi:CO/xanthine dehydrogenase FAD-binding subunit
MISHITVHSPKTLHEALTILRDLGQQTKILAGGTDLMVMLTSRALVAPEYLNIWRLKELRGIEEKGNAIRLGALTTYSQIIASPLMQKYVPILVEASRQVGGLQIQNRGTIGGNIVNASPAGDTLPVLAVFEAELEVGSVCGTRRIPFNQFYTGYRQTVLAPEELLLAIHLPKPAPEARQYFRKVGTRQAQAISKVVMAAKVRMNSESFIESIQIAYGSVAPTVVRCPQTEALLTGQKLTTELIAAAQEKVKTEIRPISDVRSTAHYRQVIAGNVLGRFLKDLIKMS